MCADETQATSTRKKWAGCNGGNHASWPKDRPASQSCKAHALQAISGGDHHTILHRIFQRFAGGKNVPLRRLTETRMRQTHHQRKEIKPNRPPSQSGKQSKKAQRKCKREQQHHQLQDAGKMLASNNKPTDDSIINGDIRVFNPSSPRVSSVSISSISNTSDDSLQLPIYDIDNWNSLNPIILT